MSSAGNTGRDIRRFLREVGVKPSVSNVERIGREVRRTEAQNEALERTYREMAAERGLPLTVDERGDVKARVKRAVKRKLARGERPRPME